MSHIISQFQAIEKRLYLAIINKDMQLATATIIKKDSNEKPD
jgi:hypothetical protein